MILEEVKGALRVTTDAPGIVSEIENLIEACKLDLKISGVSEEKIEEPDDLIKRAIVIYCKANFGFDNDDADRLHRSYVMLKQHLSLAGDYNAVE